MRRIATAVVMVIFMVTMAACGNDASVGDRDHAPADVLNFPNHFSSVSHKCDGHGHRVYIADHGSSKNGGGGVAVIDDPACR